MAGVTYPCFWLKKDARGQWYWIYYASNAEAISRSSESYHNYDDAFRGITLMRGSKDVPAFRTD